MSEKLMDWATQYIKHKDIVARKIKEISDDGIIRYKDGVQGGICLSLDQLPSNKEAKVYLILSNTTKSIDLVVDQWNMLLEYQKLCIIFTNGEPVGFWLLSPHSHNKISDGDLRKGLVSLQKNSA